MSARYACRPEVERVNFNLNDTVRVRLTDHGRKVLREQRAALLGRLPEDLRESLLMVNEDAEGWSKWQLWQLMGELGRHMVMGRENVMEMNIELVPQAAAVVAGTPEASAPGRADVEDLFGAYLAYFGRKLFGDAPKPLNNKTLAELAAAVLGITDAHRGQLPSTLSEVVARVETLLGKPQAR